MIQIYHNARCGKSRNCLTFLENNNLKLTVINYLVDTPTFTELSEILKKLKIKPIDLIRKKEKFWINEFKNKNLSDDEIIQIMVQNPILIERPIVVKGKKAWIARDSSIFLDFLA